MAPAEDFEDLVVWQKAHQLVLAVYRFSSCMPKSEEFGLVSQLKRSAVSIPANIAEGFKKRSKPDKLRYYNIAQGSLEECRYYLVLVRDLDFGDPAHLQEMAREVKGLLGSYVQRIRSS